MEEQDLNQEVEVEQWLVVEEQDQHQEEEWLVVEEKCQVVVEHVVGWDSHHVQVVDTAKVEDQHQEEWLVVEEQDQHQEVEVEDF